MGSKSGQKQTHSQVGARGGEKLASNYLLAAQTNLFDNFLTSFVTNVTPKCHKWGSNQNKILLAPLAALFCSPILKMVAHRPLLRWLVEYTYQ